MIKVSPPEEISNTGLAPEIAGNAMRQTRIENTKNLNFMSYPATGYFRYRRVLSGGNDLVYSKYRSTFMQLNCESHKCYKIV
jgi:hypothetical protein